MRVPNGIFTGFILLLFAVLSVEGADKPSKEPLTIEADKAVIDEKKGLSIYSGNVVLIQGPNTFRADKLTMHGSQQGKISKILAQGNPIRFRQKSLTDKLDITGEAERFQYFAVEQRLLLLDNAKLQQGKNVFSGDKIEYDTLRQVVTAEANESGDRRVQVTINPENLTETHQETPPAGR